MLQELRVENLALIERLRLDFGDSSSGLIVFTGETGAGKSIILQAIHLLTGGRGVSSWIRSDCEQAVIEAFFSLRDDQEDVHGILSALGLDSQTECIIRRVLNKNGKSRFYVNDRLATTRVVGELTENLVSVASQHDHQQLLNVRRHLDLLDSFAELQGERSRFSELFSLWKAKNDELNRLREQEKEKEQRKDFLGYQLREIQEANIRVGEDEELVMERDRLKSSGLLAGLAGKSYGLIHSDVLDSMRDVQKNMEQVASLDASADELAERVSSVRYELEDIEGLLLDYRDSIPMNPSRLEEMNVRIALLKQLQRKYGPDLVDVIRHMEQAEQELLALDTMEHQIQVLEKEVSVLEKEVLQEAGKLSDKRKEASVRLCTSMRMELESLSFPQAVFEVSMERSEKIGIKGVHGAGVDLVEFLFSANPGEPAKPLAKIASGGELSRLMLALKCLLARRDQVDTVIFDEIDAGIGGKAAEAVGIKIAELARHHQVFCITHLPQIAAHGDTHFHVCKVIDGGRTTTTISMLEKEEQVREIARMLGGETVTKQTMAFAEDLVARKGNGERQ